MPIFQLMSVNIWATVLVSDLCVPFNIGAKESSSIVAMCLKTLFFKMQVLLFYILTQPSNDFAYRALELGSLYERGRFSYDSIVT